MLVFVLFVLAMLLTGLDGFGASWKDFKLGWIGVALVLLAVLIERGAP
jgi:hypothetical protein